MNNQALSRRKFMQLGFAMMGGAAAGPLSGLAAPFGITAGGVLRVGMMLPQAQLQPLMTANLLDGFKLAFDGVRRIELAAETIGVTQSDAVNAAAKLLGSGVKIVVGVVSALHVAALQPLFAEHDATLVVMTAGENDYSGALPNVVFNSLHYWQSSHAAGKWAAETYGGRGMILSSFYESGFDTLLAFEQGVEASGGSIADRFVTHFDPSASRMADAIEAVRALQPDFVYAAYNGAQAAEFLRAYHAAGLGIPLVGSAFIADEVAVLPTPLRTVGAWSSALDSADNSAFMSAFKAASGRSADAFATLGYETGLWIDSAAENAGIMGMCAALEAASLSGPRGALHFDAATRTLTSSLYLRGQRQAVETLGIPSAVLRQEQKSGWISSYLSI